MRHTPLAAIVLYLYAYAHQAPHIVFILLLGICLFLRCCTYWEFDYSDVLCVYGKLIYLFYWLWSLLPYNSTCAAGAACTFANQLRILEYIFFSRSFSLCSFSVPCLFLLKLNKLLVRMNKYQTKLTSQKMDQNSGQLCYKQIKHLVHCRIVINAKELKNVYGEIKPHKETPKILWVF